MGVLDDLNFQRNQAKNTSSTPAVVPGSAQDPFYHSTGKMKEVTLPDGRKIQALDVGSTKPPAAGGIGSISVASGLAITGTERNAAKEAEARAIGYTSEYLASRGGINAQGYFNDTPISGQLTAEEQKQVRLPNGNVDTNAMASILQKKQYDEAIASGQDPTSVLQKLQRDYGSLFDASLAPDGMSSGGLGTGLSGLSFFGSSAYDSKTGTSMGTTGTGLSTGLPSTGTAGPTLAKDIFKNTLGLFFGAGEMTKTWVDELYNNMSKFYKTGASIDEAFNLSLQDVRNNPNMKEFTNRFKGIYDLQDLRQAGKPVTVPTIAEYFGTQTKMGDVLRSANLGELATEEFIGGIIGKAIPASVFAERITQIFDRIDFAPNEIKQTINKNMPNLTRTQLAKAIIGGEKSTKELAREVAGYEVLAAAEQQQLGEGNIPGGVTVERATELGALGETYQSALGKFGKVAQVLPRAKKLFEISNKTPLTQTDIENVVFRNSIRETEALQSAAMEEEARFAAQSGNIKSKSFASQVRGAY